MYSFNPIASMPVDHTGFGIVVTVCTILLIVCLFNARGAFFVYFFMATVISGIAYGISYHWTDQEPKTFKNERVTAEFQSYQPEGYNEARTSGKSTRRVDVHKMYVVYTVNGNPVIFEAKQGFTYPKTAVLYKN
jgi:hypothetical protein